jgi:hypothetical protein
MLKMKGENLPGGLAVRPVKPAIKQKKMLAFVKKHRYI